MLILVQVVNINVDGLPLFHSFNMQLWPVLVKVQEFHKMEPLLIGVFCGSSKPTSVHQFLHHFVDEMKSLLKGVLTLVGFNMLSG